MKKTPQQRLQPIQHLADNRADQAARGLSEAQRRAAEAEARLRELRGYLQEYQSRSGTALDVRMLENRRAFVARLREAESWQAAAAERAQQACGGARDHWLQQRREQQVLEKLAALYRGREQQAEERRAQKQLDEHARRPRKPGSHDEY